MALATLSIDLLAKVAKFEGDMGKAARATEKASRDISASMASIKSAMGALGTVISVGAIIQFSKNVIDSMDALNDLSDATGASIENISALEDVARRTGTSFDTVGSALVKLNKTLGDAKPGSDAADAFKALGLDVEKLKALDPAEALRQTAVALAGFADDGNKARIVQELFGKSVKEVAPLLNDLAESGKLVGTVTTEQAKQAEKFNQQLSDMQKNVLDVSRAFASVLLPSISSTIEELKLGIATFGSFTSAIVLLGTTSTSNSLSENIKKYKDQVAEFEGDRQRYVNAKSDTRGIDDAIKVAKKRLEYFTALQALQNQKYISPSDQYENESRRLGMSQLKPSLPGSTGGGKSGSKSAAAKQSEADRYLETLTKQLEKTQELTAVQQVGFDIIAGRAGKLTTDQQNNLVQLAQKIDAIRAEGQAEKDLTEILKQKRQVSIEAGDAKSNANAEYQALLSRLLSNTPTAKFEEEQKALEALQFALSKKQITETQYAEAVIASFGLMGEEINKTKSLADDLGLTFTSAFENAIVGGQSFSEVLSGLEQDIIRIVTRKTVTEPLGNAISSSLSGFNFASLLGFDGGGYTGAGPRSGGMDGKGGFMAMLHPQETVVDHTRGQRAGNSVSLVINQSFAQGTSRQTTMQAAADASRQLQYAGRNL